MKKILDACCGSRMFWFDKENPKVLYMDKRHQTYMAKDRQFIRESARHTVGTGCGLLPTVQTQGLKVCGTDGKTRPIDLMILATPIARDYRSGFKENSEAMKKRMWRSVNLHEHIQRDIGKNFQLNPRFVGEMMGFPKKWTESPFQSGVRNPSKDTEMP